MVEVRAVNGHPKAGCGDMLAREESSKPSLFTPALGP